MNRIFSIVALSVLSLSFMVQGSFKTEQKKNQRVKQAYKEKEHKVNLMLNKCGVDTLSYEVFIRVFKQEDVLELWAKTKGKDAWIKVNDYKVCSRSGDIGPKRKQGDMQVPEGFYHISRFNPWSSFYLSLGLNYPNSSDRKLSTYSDLGGDIFIHGSCVTIGCLPLTDDKIKEVYLLAVEAKDRGQAEIPVHIFPARLTDETMEKLKIKYSDDEKLIIFWENLKDGYKYFEEKKKLPKVSTDSKGKYLFE